MERYFKRKLVMTPLIKKDSGGLKQDKVELDLSDLPIDPGLRRPLFRL